MVLRQVDDDLLVYDPEKKATHLLNMTAAAILDLCDGSTPPPSIAGAIASVTTADPAKVLADVETLLLELAEKGLITESVDPPAL